MRAITSQALNWATLSIGCGVFAFIWGNRGVVERCRWRRERAQRWCAFVAAVIAGAGGEVGGIAVPLLVAKQVLDLEGIAGGNRLAKVI